ncbi:MAG TPA: ATP-binding protein [Patescibacteria group bacterium]|nr:ATP-binding protein [Patescibacteria group bacterium]
MSLYSLLKFNEKKETNPLTYGHQDILDFISYAGLKETDSYIKLEGQYIRSMYISGYPFNASSGWLNDLININKNLDISFHINEVLSTLAVPKLNRKITELESLKRTLLREGQLIGPELIDPLHSATQLRNKIMRGQEKLFQISIYIALSNKSLDELNKLTKIIQTTLSAKLFNVKISYFRQIYSLQSILPRGMDELTQKRNLDTTSTALTFPFISSELVHENGIYYGINKFNNSLVILDRFSLNNANSIIFAESGSGKSYLSKVEIIRQLLYGTKIIVIDPEREYKLLCDSINGSYIKLSSKSKNKINPFDITISNNKKSTIYEHIQDLTEVISLLCDGLSPREKAAVDKALINLYKNNKKSQPKLKDFYDEINKLGRFILSERLEKFIKGSLSEVFNKESNVDLSNKLVVFDIKDMPEKLRKIMMFIISVYISNQIKNATTKTLLVIDEAWMLLEHDESARFVTGLVRRARKYYLGVSLITQAANDFLSNEYGRIIASQSSLRMLLRQDTTTIDNVSKQFNLSEFEKNYLLSCDRGEALFLADQDHVAVKITASEEEHPLITTNPKELINYDSKI